MRRTIRNLICAAGLTAVAAGLVPHSANGAIIVNTDKSNSPPTVSDSDLAETQYLSSSATGGTWSVVTLHAELFNGSVNNSANVTMDSNNTFTVNFDISTNTLGYDITGIDSYFGWETSGGGRSNQGYSIVLTFLNDSTATLAGPTHWEPNSPDSAVWTTVSFTESGGGTLYSDTVKLNSGDAVAGSSVLASGVKAITFDIANNANVNNSQLVGREVDIFGTATIPEPGSLALLGIGGLLLLSIRRR